MKGMRVKSALIVLFVLLMMSTVETKEDIPFLWKGTITVKQIKYPGEASPATGEVIIEWQLNVNWKETKKNDIKDKNGNLVGQLVKLEDNIYRVNYS